MNIFHKWQRKMTAWDRLLSLKIYRWTGKKRMDLVMSWFSHLGDGWIYCIVAGLLFIINRKLATSFLFAAILAFSIQLISQHLLKKMFKRIRPFKMLPDIRQLVKPLDEFSFPSGHTAGAFLMATLLSSFYSILFVPGYVMASMVGFSRVYNGVHYPSDVIAGMILGIGSAKFSLSFF